MLKLFHRLTWPQVLVVNLTLLTFTGYVLIQGSLKNSTRTTGTAAPPAPTPAESDIYPSGPPKIDVIEYFFAKPGDQVRLRGLNFGSSSSNSTLIIGASSVPADHILRWTDDHIDFTVPADIKSNPVLLVVNHKPAPGPVLSVYHQPSDPHLLYRSQGAGYALDLVNAPKNSSISLTLADGQTITQTVSQDSLTLVQLPQKISLIHASLQDNRTRTYLPLYLDPLSAISQNL